MIQCDSLLQNNNNNIKSSLFSGKFSVNFPEVLLLFYITKEHKGGPPTICK